MDLVISHPNRLRRRHHATPDASTTGPQQDLARPQVDAMALRSAAERQANEILEHIHAVADALNNRPLLLGDEPLAAATLEAGEQLVEAVARLAPANFPQALEHCILQVGAARQCLFQLCSAAYNLGNDSDSGADVPATDKSNSPRSAPHTSHAPDHDVAGTSDGSDNGWEDDAAAVHDHSQEYGEATVSGSGETQQQLRPDECLRLQPDVNGTDAGEEAWVDEFQQENRRKRALRRAARKRRARRRRRRAWAAEVLREAGRHLVAACAGLGRLQGLLEGWQGRGDGLLQGLPDGPLLRVLQAVGPDVRLVCRRFQAVYRLPRFRAYGTVGSAVDAIFGAGLEARLASHPSFAGVTDCDLENAMSPGLHLPGLAAATSRLRGLQRLHLPAELHIDNAVTVASVQALLAADVAAGDAAAGDLLARVMAWEPAQNTPQQQVEAAATTMAQLMARNSSTLQHLRAPLLATAGLLHLPPSPPALRSLSVNAGAYADVPLLLALVARTLQSIASLKLLTRLDLSCHHAGARYGTLRPVATSAADILAAAGQLPLLVDLSLPMYGMLWTMEGAEQLQALTALTALQMAGEAESWECGDSVRASLACLTRISALSLFDFLLWGGLDHNQYGCHWEMRAVAACLPVSSLELVVLRELRVEDTWRFLYDSADAAVGLRWGGLTRLKLSTQVDAHFTVEHLIEDEEEVDLQDRGQQLVRSWLDHGLAMGLGRQLRCLELENVAVPTGFCRRVGLQVPLLQRLVLWKCTCAVTKREEEVLYKRVSVAGLERLQGLTSLTWCIGKPELCYEEVVEGDLEMGLGLGCLGQLASLRELSTDLGAGFLGALLPLQQLGALTLWEVAVARVCGVLSQMRGLRSVVLASHGLHTPPVQLRPADWRAAATAAGAARL